MNTERFKDKVKRNVAANFDESIDIYRTFEEKHGFFKALTLKLAETVGIGKGASILDVGCGNGISAQALNGRYGCKVMGVDLSPKMIAAGRSLCDGDDIRLVVGDGENLSAVVGGRRFDYALYNASIFIFPDVAKTLSEAHGCLRSGGRIAFSFYPTVVGKNEEDLFEVAFKRLGQPLPRFRVITDYSAAVEALSRCCKDIRQHRWSQPLDIRFLQDFFSIPAQSASLFPGRDYETRRDLARHLFSTLGDMTGTGRIVWRMAYGSKVTAT